MNIIAHRGHSADWPENTPSAWSAARDAGAFAIEADVRMTSDGIFVCSHDPDLRRLFGRGEQIADCKSADLLGIVGPLGHRLHRVAELLPLITQGMHILLDIKDERTEALYALTSLLRHELRQEQHQYVILGLHDPASVTLCRKEGFSRILGFLPNPEEARVFREAGASMLRLWERESTAEMVRTLSDDGASVWVTLGGRDTGRAVGDFEPDVLRHLARLGVQGALVNDSFSAERILNSTIKDHSR